MIDPVRLTDRFAVFAGYKPDVSRGGLSEDYGRELKGSFDPEELAPVVVEQLPAAHPEARMKEIAADVAEALRAFLRGVPTDAETADRIVREVTAEPGPDGEVEFVQRKASDSAESKERTALSLVSSWIEGRSRRHGTSFEWVRGLVPQQLTEDSARYLFKVMQRIDEHDIRTHAAWVKLRELTDLKPRAHNR